LTCISAGSFISPNTCAASFVIYHVFYPPNILIMLDFLPDKIVAISDERELDIHGILNKRTEHKG